MSGRDVHKADPAAVCAGCGEKLGHGHLDTCPRVPRVASPADVTEPAATAVDREKLLPEIREYFVHVFSANVDGFYDLEPVEPGPCHDCGRDLRARALRVGGDPGPAPNLQRWRYGRLDLCLFHLVPRLRARTLIETERRAA